MNFRIKELAAASLILGLSLSSGALAHTSSNFSDSQTTLECSLEKKVKQIFPNKQIKDMPDFRKYADSIMKIVAKKKGYEIDDKIPKPTIITEDQIDCDEFSRRLGYPAGTFDAICPYYFYHQNEILLLNDSRLDTLAHEFVHYFQVKYGHANFDKDVFDANAYEVEAVSIQRWFKKNYMRKD